MKPEKNNLKKCNLIRYVIRKSQKYLNKYQIYMRQLKITKQVTNRETPSLDKYLQEIGRVDLITPEEEVELAQRIKKRR